MSKQREQIRAKVESLGGHIRVKAEISIDGRLVEHYREASQNRAAEEASDLLKDAVQGALRELAARFHTSQARKAGRVEKRAAEDAQARAGVDHAADSGRTADASSSEPSARGERVEGAKGYERDDDGKVIPAGATPPTFDSPEPLAVGERVVFTYEGQEDLEGVLESEQSDGGTVEVLSGDSIYIVPVDQVGRLED